MGSIIGRLSSGLTKTGVTDGKTTQYYDNDAQAAQAIAAEARKSVQPSTVSMSANDINDPGAVSMVDNTTPSPVMTHPSFSDAMNDHPDQLSKKGAVLSLLINGGVGAMRGAAASVPQNPHISPGLGPALLAGWTTPEFLKEQRDEQAARQLALQKESAEIAAIPIHQKQQQALIDSEIAKNNAVADRRDVFQVAGGGLYQRLPDGSVQELRAPNHQATLAEVIAARQQAAEGMDFPTDAAKAAFIAGTKYNPLNDVDSAEYKERQRTANQRSNDRRYAVDNRKGNGLSIKGKAKDPFSAVGGKAF